MGFRDESDRSEIRARAAHILRKCGDKQYEEPDNESIAMVAKIWSDIYKAMEIKEVKVDEY